MPRTTDDLLNRIIRRGIKLNRRGFTLYYLQLYHPPSPRIVISQKVDKRAVVRNRLRRRIRAILAQAKFTNRALVVITRRELVTLSFPELRAEFAPILSQIK